MKENPTYTYMTNCFDRQTSVLVYCSFFFSFNAQTSSQLSLILCLRNVIWTQTIMFVPYAEIVSNIQMNVSMLDQHALIINMFMSWGGRYWRECTFFLMIKFLLGFDMHMGAICNVGQKHYNVLKVKWYKQQIQQLLLRNWKRAGIG